MPTLTLVQSNSAGSSANTTSQAVTLPAGVTSGNLLVATVSGATTGGTFGGPSGWAQAVANAPAGSSAPMTSIWYLVAGSSQAGQTSWTFTQSASHRLIVCIEEWNSSSGWAATVLDKTAQGDTASTPASATAIDSGTTGTTSQAAELQIGSLTYKSGAQSETSLSSGWTRDQEAVSGTISTATMLYAETTAAGTADVSYHIGTAELWAGCIATFKPVSAVTHSGTVSMDGEGTLSGTGLAIVPATAALSGTGTLSGSALIVLAGAAALSGTGTLTAAGISGQGAVLSGTGTLTPFPDVTYLVSALLSGTGTLSPAGTVIILVSAGLSGTGTLSLPFVTLSFPAVLAGLGTLTVIGTGGVVQAGHGLPVSYAYPGTSQVAVAPPGTSGWQYLGSLGIISSLKYSFVMPGGCDQLSCTLLIPADYRTQLLDPGWQVRVTRGGHVVWSGRLDEPVATAQGWNITAEGDGNRGADFVAYYTSAWPSGEPDQAVNNAIGRGLPWQNAGIGTPAGMWLGQGQDPASATVTDLLNLICTRGGLTWYVNSQPDGAPADLKVFPLPTAVNRLLVVTSPVARTLGGDINTIFIRYQSGAAAGTSSASFAVTSVQNAASVAMHGVTEAYLDLSSASVTSAGAAQAVGNFVLSIYQRASFAGPFTAAYGQLLNAGGAPVDPGADQCGTVMRLLLTDFGYGGEVTPQPVTFITGAYAWDDFAQVATITPFQTLNQSLSGLLSTENTVLTPITAQA